MEEYCATLLKLLKVELFDHACLIILSIIAIIMCIMLRRDKQWRIMFWVSCICLIGSVWLSFVEILPIYKDYRDKTFVELEEATIISHTSDGIGNSIRKIIVRTSEGKEIPLEARIPFEKGEFKGRVGYSERSGCLVQWIESKE